MNGNVDHGLGVITVCQFYINHYSKLINIMTNSCPTPLEDIIIGKVYTCVGAGNSNYMKNMFSILL